MSADHVRRMVRFGRRDLRAHTDAVLWGTWGVVDGRAVLTTGGRDGKVLLWDPQDGIPVMRVGGDPSQVPPWGAWNTEWRWADLAVGRRVWALGPHPRGQGQLTISETFKPDLVASIAGGWVGSMTRRALIVIDDRGPGLWYRSTVEEAVYEAAHGNGRVVWGAWLNDDETPLVATGGTDGNVHIWRVVHGGFEDAGLLSHRTAGGWGAWARLDGQPLLATPGVHHSVVLWDPIGTGIATQPPTEHTDLVTWGSWGEVEGRLMLATGSADRTVRIWDPRTGAQVGPALQGHSGVVNWGAWAGVDGSAVLATGDSAGVVRLWDPASGRALGDPLMVKGASRWGAWQDVEGRPILATGGEDPVVQLWEVIDERPIGATLPPYRSDALTAVDQLDRASEAAAVAELITARSARPPLAIGLFGDWGEGKSHFMALLQSQVTAAAGRHGILAHQHVRQVRFNAWHYAETDLWASLVTELFTQLAGPGSGEDAHIDQRRQSRLAAELIEQRGLRERLIAVRSRRDELHAFVEGPARLWSLLTESQRGDVRAIAGDKPEEVFAQAVRAGTAITATGRLSWRLLRGVRAALLARAGLVVLAVAAAAALVWWLPSVAQWWAAVPGVAALLAATDAANRVFQGLRRRGREIWTGTMDFVAQQNRQLTAAAAAADAEVAELERQMRDFTAAGQLAGAIAERAASTDYRSRLDVMSRIREDFVRMSRLLALAGADPVPDEVGDELPRIDRIVIYVDDLDRCPPARVVEMLEAVHLLLAVDLFVVVVAVDPRWLMSAIGSHYRNIMSTDSTTPAQYLEKIFQVVLTLPPLDTSGYQRMLRGLVGTRSDDPAPTPRAESEPVVTAPGPVEARPATERTGVRLPSPRLVDRVDPFALDPDEIRLLDLLGPPHLITTPRQVKRLANSYGLLTVLRADQRAADLTDRTGFVQDGDGTEYEVRYRPYRSGLVLLATLIAFPAAGPELFTDLHGAAAENPKRSWADYLAKTELVQWRALEAVTTSAAVHHLDLPEPIGAWSEWLVPVGRLSFPTGRHISRLR
jgi:WD40 repeat protein